MSSELYVDVRTDLRPGHEFSLVRTSLVGAGAAGEGEASLVASVGEDDRYLDGTRAAEFTSLTSSSFLIRVALVADDGTVALERTVRVERSSSRQAVTVVLARDCVMVVCPAPSDMATATQCGGGRCVEESCSPETPEFCPPPECVDVADCGTPAGSCAVSRCVEGTCLLSVDDALCAPGDRCSQDLGCVPDGSTLEPGLLAWFPLADDPSDGTTLEVVSGRSGTCTQCPTLSTGGPVGAYQLFDGSDDLLEFPSHARIESATAITVAGWARLDALQDSAIVAKALGTGTDNTFEIKFDRGGGPVYNSGGGAWDSLEGPPVTAGEWHHVCGTHEDGVKILYVDGVEVDRSAVPLTFDDNTITIGADYNGGVRFVPFVGGLADIRIYGRVLTPSEVMTLATPGG